MTSTEIVSWAVTVRLPWAAAIRSGAKRVENRSRPIPADQLGTRVGIHAAAAWSREGADDPRMLDWWWGDAFKHYTLDAVDFNHLNRHIIAVTTIVDCHIARRTPYGKVCCEPWGDLTYNGGTAWHIVFGHVDFVQEPVGPIRGRLNVPFALDPPVTVTL